MLLSDTGALGRVGVGGRARVQGAFALAGMVEQVERVYGRATESGRP